MWFESQSSEELEIGPDFCYHDTGFTLTGQVSRTIFSTELSQPYSFHFDISSRMDGIVVAAHSKDKNSLQRK